MCGDFNDHGLHDYWKSDEFYPFSKLSINIDHIKNLKVSTHKQPPETCCVGKTSLRGGKNIDNLLFNTNDLIKKNKNKLYLYYL